MVDWFLTGEDFQFLADVLVSFVGFGVGLGAVLWLIGLCIYAVKEFVKF